MAKPPTYGPHQLADRLGVPRWVTSVARELDVIPAPAGPGGKWTAAQADAIAADLNQVLAAVEADVEANRTIGAAKAADRLGGKFGLPVEYADVEALAERGRLHAVGEYKGFPLYRVAEVESYDDRDELAAVVDERRAWIAASLTRAEATALLGWHRDDFDAVVARCGLKPGRFNRWARDLVDDLAADVDLQEQVRVDRLVTADEACGLIDLQRRDFDHARRAGFIAPATSVEVKRGRRYLDVPLYRVGDVEALLEVPGVDWNAVREVPPGKPSALRHLAPREPSRADVIRRFAAELADEHGVEVVASYDDRREVWRLSWADPRLSVETVKAAVKTDPAVRAYRRDIVLRAPDE